MKQIQFPPELMESIKDQLRTYMNQNPGPYFAAFDADGTLWNTDVGENFFQYQIDNCKLKPLMGIDPWKHYKSLKSEDPKKGYLWLAQINEGYSIQRVRLWAKSAVADNPVEYLDSQKQLIRWMQNNGITPIVVTASIKWAVEPAAEALGIPYDDVCGVQTAFSDSGFIGLKQKGPITWRAGKPEALLERTAGVQPIFCAGNTSGDTQLLQASCGVRLAIQTQTTDNPLKRDEDTLKAHAIESDWLRHHFYES